MGHPKAMFTVQSNLQKVWKLRRSAVPGAQKEILSGKIRATDREISSIAKGSSEKRPEVVAELQA